MAWGVPEIRGWLLQHPRPATVKVQSSDGRAHEVSVTSGVSWMAIAQSVHALSPSLIECYDDKGKIIRAVRPDDDDNNGDKDKALPLQLGNVDPQSAQLIHFADLLAAAYRHSTDVAFERLASLFESSVRRAESLERTVDKLVRQQIKEQLEAEPAEATSELGEMVRGFVQAAQSAQHETNGSSNGKG